MVQSTLVVQEHDLEWLKFLRQLTSRDVCVHVQDLASRRLGKARQDGQRTRANRRFNRAFVNARNLAHEAVLLAVEVVRGKDAGRNGSRARTKLLKSGDELEIFLEEDTPCDTEGLRV